MMAFSVKFVFFIGAFLCVINHALCSPGTDSFTSDVPTTQRPSTIYFKKSLEQLKKMEESALKGWYDMVQKFLALIKPDDEILDILIDYAQGTSTFQFPSSAIELAQKNSVFLAMVCLGLIYVVVMLLSGFFFFCCRMFGRCGAKESQRQTRHINCWRTTHKFFLIFMVAFLVVPIVSMIIINQHMKQSFPSIKSNASDIFPMISEFANRTERDVNDIARDHFSTIIDKVKDKNNFDKGFARPLEEDISRSVSSESLEFVKNVASWVVEVVEDYIPQIKLKMDRMSNNVLELQDIIRNLTEETEQFKRHCSKEKGNICQIAIEKLSIEKLNVSRIRGQMNQSFDKLSYIDTAELQNISQKIQNKTLLTDLINEKRETLESFADDLKPKQEEVLKKIKVEVQKYADEIRYYSNQGQHHINTVMAKSESYEYYRWWIMFGVVIVLIIPVLFLILGLLFGCCGYRKGYHPSKRPSKSHCGGLCLILAVYYFFLVAWILMLFTVALFIIGGNVQSFVCIPLYQDDFVVLDQVKAKLEVSYPELENVLPSKFLNNCREDKSVFEALDLSVLNKSSSQILKEELERNIKGGEIATNLRNSIFDEIQKIRGHINNYSSFLNLSEVRDLPKNLSNSLDDVRQNIHDTEKQIKNALSEQTISDKDIEKDLQLIDKTAANFIRILNNFSEDLDTFSVTVSEIYDNATTFMENSNTVKDDLQTLEGKLPGLVQERLLQYIMSVVNTDISEVLLNVGHCEDLWIAFDTSRTVVCDFVVYPVNGFWFSLGWALVFIIPTIIFAIKLSRHYIRMKYDSYRFDERETAPLDDMSRVKPTPFSYTPGNTWMPQQNYMVHPTSSNHIRQFDYK